MAKALIEACDAEQVALHEPLLALLFDAAPPRATALQCLDSGHDQPEGAFAGSDDVGYRTFTFGGAADTEGTLVALRYAAHL